jgi:hypothetical protein
MKETSEMELKKEVARKKLMNLFMKDHSLQEKKREKVNLFTKRQMIFMKVKCQMV